MMPGFPSFSHEGLRRDTLCVAHPFGVASVAVTRGFEPGGVCGVPTSFSPMFCVTRVSPFSFWVFHFHTVLVIWRPGLGALPPTSISLRRVTYFSSSRTGLLVE